MCGYAALGIHSKGLRYVNTDNPHRRPQNLTLIKRTMQTFEY